MTTGSRSAMSVVARSLMTSLLAVVVSGHVSVTYVVSEELPVGSVVGNVVVDFALTTLRHNASSSVVSFEFLTEPDGAGGLLGLEDGSWDVLVAGRIDRESLCAGNAGRCVLRYTLAMRPLVMFRLLGLELEVLDVNDNRPTFVGQRRRHVTENAEVGSLLTVATVGDLDVGVNGLERYETTRTDCAGIDARPVPRRLAGGEVELQVRVLRPLDREAQSGCTLTLSAADGGRPARTASTRVDIIIDDVNDCAPSFDADSYEVWIAEDVAVGTCIVAVSATDRDDGLNSQLTYSFDLPDWNGGGGLRRHRSPEPGLPFQIDPDSGLVCLSGEVDFESQSVFLLPLSVRDKGAESLSGRSTLTVYVTDVNDQAPIIVVEVICGTAGVVEVRENDDSGLTLALVTVRDLDSGRNGRVVCRLNETARFQLVEIYAGQYHITSASTLDREEKDRYSLEIHCHDLGSPPMSSSSLLSVRVLDVNDETPRFTQSVYTATIVENWPRGQPLLRVVAVDEDVGLNGDVTYLLQGDPDGLLDVDARLGLVSSAVELDFEARRLVTATVVAVDGGVPSRSSSAQILVRVANVDDEPLTFSRPRYDFSVAENQPRGTLLGHVTACDADIAPTERRVRYGLRATDGSRLVMMFYVVPDTGAVLTNASLDFESQRQYELVVFAVELSQPDFTAVCDVTVTVDDVSDRRPRFVFPSPGGGDHVTVTVDAGGPLDQVVCTLRADDDDDDDRLTFRLVSDHADDPVNFHLDPVTGRLRITADRLQVGYVEVTVVAEVSDNGTPVPLQDTAYLRVIVQSSRSSSSWHGAGQTQQRRSPRPRGDGVGARRAAGAVTAVAVACCAVVLVGLAVVLAVVARRRTSHYKNDVNQSTSIQAAWPV